MPRFTHAGRNALGGDRHDILYRTVRAEMSGLASNTRFSDNDVCHFFQAIDGLLKTGPTRTNVNDFRAVIISG